MNNQTICPKGIARPSRACLAAAHSRGPGGRATHSVQAVDKLPEGHRPARRVRATHSAWTFDKYSNRKSKIRRQPHLFSKCRPTATRPHSWTRMEAQLDFYSRFEKSRFRGIPGDFSSWEIKKSSSRDLVECRNRDRPHSETAQSFPCRITAKEAVRPRLSGGSMRTVDIGEVIDGQKVGPYQWLIVFMAWLTLFLDGVDNQSIAYVGTALTEDWGLARGALRTVFSMGVLGVAIGAFIVGPLADRYGRKLVTVATVIYVAVLSLIVTQVAEISALLMPIVPAADNLTVLTVLRFFTGLGLGAVVPLGVVIVNEFAPKRRRAAMVTLMGCGYAVGSSSGGFLSSYLVPAFGWPTQFYVASALTFVMAVVLWAFLPESIRMLTVKGRTNDIIAILRKINPALSFSGDTQFVLRQEAREASASKFRPVRLF